MVSNGLGGTRSQRIDTLVLPAEVPPESKPFFKLGNRSNLKVIHLVRGSCVQVPRSENQGQSWWVLSGIARVR